MAHRSRFQGRPAIATPMPPRALEVERDVVSARATGLFRVTSLAVPFAQVVSVDPLRRRVGIGVVPEPAG
jgi:hypothetical protein